jgi:hypothetical protein
MYVCKFNDDKNALKYEKLCSKFGAVYSRISQDILAYTDKNKLKPWRGM